jgi:hypothetical protein
MPRVEQTTEQPAGDQGAARVAESVRRALLLVGPAEGTGESPGAAKRAREATMIAREHL